MSETPELRWFDPYPKCRACPRRADGTLFGSRNESYGPHCRKCAERRLKASEKARQATIIPPPPYNHPGDVA